MTHDAMCLHRDAVKVQLPPTVCTYCQLIAAVREDERSKRA